MIEVKIAGFSELVVPPHGRRAFISYMIETERLILPGYEEIGKGKDKTESVAVYTALIRALETIRKKKLSDEKIVIKSNSRIFVKQITKQSMVRIERLKPLFHKAKTLSEGMDIEFKWIPKRENKKAHNLIRGLRERERAKGEYFQL